MQNTVDKFEQRKKDMANGALWSFPNPDSSLALFSDASVYFGVGSVLQQWEEDSWKPLAFFLKKLTNTQKGHTRSRKQDLKVLAEELSLTVRPEFKISQLHKLIIESPGYDEEFTPELLAAIREERERKEECEREERERKEKNSKEKKGKEKKNAKE
ncbi:hypothetical protein X975_10287, partial [Stegodyphus mimosarum]